MQRVQARRQMAAVAGCFAGWLCEREALLPINPAQISTPVMLPIRPRTLEWKCRLELSGCAPNRSWRIFNVADASRGEQGKFLEHAGLPSSHATYSCRDAASSRHDPRDACARALRAYSRLESAISAFTMLACNAGDSRGPGTKIRQDPALQALSLNRYRSPDLDNIVSQDIARRIRVSIGPRLRWPTDATVQDPSCLWSFAAQFLQS